MTTGHSLPNQGGTTKRTKPSSLTVMGGEGFFYLRLLKKLPLQRSRSFDPFDTGYAAGIVLPAALQGRLFEQPH